MEDTNPRRLLTFNRSQHYLDVSRAALRRLVETGAIPVVTLATEGRRRPFKRIALEDLEAFIARARGTSVTPPPTTQRSSPSHPARREAPRVDHAAHGASS
jgi:hypothetical protein